MSRTRPRHPSALLGRIQTRDPFARLSPMLQHWSRFGLPRSHRGIPRLGRSGSRTRDSRLALTRDLGLGLALVSAMSESSFASARLNPFHGIPCSVRPLEPFALYFQHFQIQHRKSQIISKFHHKIAPSYRTSVFKNYKNFLYRFRCT